jgi:hypothetical protein
MTTVAAPTLGEIFARYGCDKGSHPAESWQWPMSYERTYGPLFAPLRDEPITLLELGWGEWDPDRKDHANPNNGGRSARAWRDYFTNPEAHIAVVDVEPKVNTAPGVSLFQGDQTDPEFLRSVYLQTGRFDIIIDDASHISSMTIESFKILWPYMKPGGLYCVEDLHSSYHDYYFGPLEAARNPAEHGGLTAVAFFKRLADEAFFNGQRKKGPAVDQDPRSWDCYPRRYWMGYPVEEVRFCAPQLIVVRKRRFADYPPNTPLP